MDEIKNQKLIFWAYINLNLKKSKQILNIILTNSIFKPKSQKNPTKHHLKYMNLLSLIKNKILFYF